MEFERANKPEKSLERATDEQIESIFRFVSANWSDKDFNFILDNEKVKNTVFDKDKYDSVSIDFNDSKTINIGGIKRNLPVLSINLDKFTSTKVGDINEVTNLFRTRISLIDNHDKNSREKRFYIIVNDSTYDDEKQDTTKTNNRKYHFTSQQADQVLEILKMS